MAARRFRVNVRLWTQCVDCHDGPVVLAYYDVDAVDAAAAIAVVRNSGHIRPPPPLLAFSAAGVTRHRAFRIAGERYQCSELPPSPHRPIPGGTEHPTP